MFQFSIIMSNCFVSFPFFSMHDNLLDSSFQEYKLKLISIIYDSLLDWGLLLIAVFT